MKKLPKTFDEYVTDVKRQLVKQKTQQNRRNELKYIFERLNGHAYRQALMYDYIIYKEDCDEQTQLDNDNLFEQHVRRTVKWLAI